MSGIGTGQTVALWEGAGSVTDSETLGNAPITDELLFRNGNNTTFAGNITVSGTSSSFNTGNGTFVTNDASNYPRFTANNGSAQLGLFRAGGNAGGMYIGGAGDGFRLYTSSFSQKLFIDTNGNATFAGSVSAEDNIYLTDAGTVRAKLLLNASDRDNVELRAESLGSTMKFFTVGTEALELDASQNAIFTGNVGIGTTLNLGRELLVKGEIAALDNTGTNDNQILMAVNNTIGNLAVTYGSTGSYVPFQLETSGTPRFTVSTAGAIKFNAYDSTNNTGTPTYMLGTDGSGNVVKVLGGDIPGGGGTVTGTGTATRVAFWSASDTITSDADLYWDNTNKRLGIGVSSPAALLEINGTGDAIRVESTNTGAGGAQIDLLHYSTSPADNDTMAYINMGGYYNTTPSQAYFSSIRTVATDISARQGELTFWTVNSTLQQRMVIDTDGNVGIGTTDPTTRLYVDGGESTFNRGNSAGTIATFRGQNAAKAVIGTATSYFTGNVGIGTTSPDTNLEIGAATNVAPKLRLTLNDSGNSIVAGQEYGGIQWKGNDGQGDGVRADIRVFGEGSSGETYMAFGTMTSGTSASTNAVERMRIDSSGNVGIGLTPNASYSKLQVKAPASSYGFDLVGRDAGSNGESQITFWNSNQTTQLSAIANISDNLIFYTSTAERMRITSAGDVQIVGNRYLYANPSAGSTTIGAGFQLDAVNNIMKLWTNNTERMRITSGGNVGIGTTLPGTALAFGGLGSIWVNNDTTNPFGMDTVGGELRLFVGTGSASYQMKFGKYNGTTFTPHMTIGDDGSNPSYVGIGTTSPSEKLEVTGKVRIFDGGYPYIDLGVSTSNYFRIIHDNPNDILKIGKNGATTSSSLIVQGSTGNVGIGGVPGSRFDIQGTQGQLFSVTDDLSGSIFAVSDISGVPIFDVNSSGQLFSVTIKNGKKIFFNNPISTASGSIVCPVGGSLVLQAYGNDMIYLNENSEIRFSIQVQV